MTFNDALIPFGLDDLVYEEVAVCNLSTPQAGVAIAVCAAHRDAERYRPYKTFLQNMDRNERAMLCRMVEIQMEDAHGT